MGFFQKVKKIELVFEKKEKNNTTQKEQHQKQSKVKQSKANRHAHLQQ
jgi:hypothetical protein